MSRLEERLKLQAQKLGFELVGIAPATAADGFDRLRDWLARGFAAEMGYMDRHAEARRHPESILPAVRSIILVGMNYKPLSANDTPPGYGRVARYAQGDDYHALLRERLKQLLFWLQEERPNCRGRAVVDTAPLLEREFGRRAGLGWFGKNTMLLNKRLGSYFFLGALLVDFPLEADAPHTANHCGSCTRCLDACPTEACAAPGVLDARRCISYLTIEHRGQIAPELQPQLAGWIFGCDICQEVCPWNRKAPPGLVRELQPRQELEALDPCAVLRLSEEAFRSQFQGTALLRTGRSGLARNAALLLGVAGDSTALPDLRESLRDPDPVVADAARWAIEQIVARDNLR